MTPLQQAAQAVIDKFEQSHPLKELAVLELRKALADEQAQAVKPVGYFYTSDGMWRQAFDLQFKEAYTPLFTHPPSPTTSHAPL